MGFTVFFAAFQLFGFGFRFDLGRGGKTFVGFDGFGPRIAGDTSSFSLLVACRGILQSFVRKLLSSTSRADEENKDKHAELKAVRKTNGYRTT